MTINRHAYPALLLMSGTSDEGIEGPSDIVGDPEFLPVSSALQHNTSVQPAWQITGLWSECLSKHILCKEAEERSL